MSLLYVLPHAGGAAHSYKGIQDVLAGRVEVRCLELPGRGRRAADPCLRAWDAAIDEVLRMIDPPVGRPWALFGHSMGALLGIEALHRRATNDQPMPVYFAASGSLSPGHRQQHRIAHLPRDAFWAAVARYGGMPAQILAVAEFRDYFETILRMDFSVIEDGQPGQGKIDVPIHVLYGDRDMSAKDAESWYEATTGRLSCHTFPGDHFYLFDHPFEIAATLEAAFEGRA